MSFDKSQGSVSGMVQGEVGVSAAGFGGSAASPPPPGAIAGGGVPSAPPTDRGATVTTGVGISEIDGHLDYLNLTCWTDESTLRAVFAEWQRMGPGADIFDLPDPFADFREYSHGGRGFSRMLVGEGITVYLDPKHGQGYCSIEMKGSYLERWRLCELVDLVRMLEARCERLRCTRLDWAWDYCRFTPVMVENAIDAGNIRGNFHRPNGWAEFHRSKAAEGRYRVQDPSELDAFDRGSKYAGRSAYVGSKASLRRLVVYDGRGFTRAEFRCRKERADRVLESLMSLPSVDLWSRAMVSHLLDFVAFVDSQADSNISRCPELSWWSEFVAGAKRACLKIPRTLRDSATKVVRHVERAVKGMATAMQVLRGTELEGCLLGMLRNACGVVLCKSLDKVNQLRAAVENELNEVGTGRFRNLFCDAPDDPIFTDAHAKALRPIRVGEDARETSGGVDLLGVLFPQPAAFRAW